MQILRIERVCSRHQKIRTAGDILDHAQFVREHKQGHVLARRQSFQKLQHLPAGIELIWQGPVVLIRVEEKERHRIGSGILRWYIRELKIGGRPTWSGTWGAGRRIVHVCNEEVYLLGFAVFEYLEILTGKATDERLVRAANDYIHINQSRGYVQRWCGRRLLSHGEGRQEKDRNHATPSPHRFAPPAGSVARHLSRRSARDRKVEADICMPLIIDDKGHYRGNQPNDNGC